MSAPPPGAQLSEDGAYWWDEPNQQWQLAAAGDTSGGGSTADPAEQGGYAQAEQIAVEGVCQSGELTDEEIAQVLSDAGVSVAEA